MEAPLAEIKPNIKKAFISNLLIVIGIVILIICLLLYLNNIVGLNVFLDVLKQFDISISPITLLIWSIVIILLFIGLLLILNYVILSKHVYSIYSDKIVYSRNFFVMQLNEQIIPYSNVTKISYEKKPFLNTAAITLELTGMKESRIIFNFIDEAEEVVEKIQNLIKDYRAQYYAQYTQDYRMQNIMNRL